MKILFIEPEKRPAVREIDGSLEAMQSLVGGTIQVIYPFKEPVALVCNDDGKLLGLPVNRGLYDSNGVLYDVVCGSFFLCGAPPDSENFVSLTENQLQRFSRLFEV